MSKEKELQRSMTGTWQADEKGTGAVMVQAPPFMMLKETEVSLSKGILVHGLFMSVCLYLLAPVLCHVSTMTA